MEKYNIYDVIVIGAGSAGLSAARILKSKGLKYKIIHHGFKGTTCASRGCMPSKALIQVAKSFYEHHKFNDFGIKGGDKLTVDMPAVFNHVRRLRDRFVSHIVDGMENHDVVYGQSKFIARDTIDVDGTLHKSKNFIICTGASPRIPDIFKPYEQDLLTSDTLFEQVDLPKRIAVIGTGSVGVEMGQALGRLGIKITIIGRNNTIAGLTDPEMVKVARDILSKNMNVILNNEIQRVHKTKDAYEITLKDQVIICDKILIAAGHVSNIGDMGLQDIGVTFTDKNIPKMNIESLKIPDYPIYMSGDVNGYKALLHEAHDESDIIVAHILGEKPPMRRVPLAITFTDPSIAHIGQSPKDIDEDFITGDVSYCDQGRARVMGENHGLLKIYVSKKSKIILGACLIAPAGEHMAHLIALAVQEKLSVDDFLKLPFYHPTLEEGLRTALRDVYDQSR